jgi:hypothetical protein
MSGWPILADLIRVPRDGERRPDRITAVPEIDTGGAWRPAHRPQDPGQDPAEPGGGEPSSAGTDHGWANCTMSAGAVAYAYEAHYAGDDDSPWGGHLRHSGQPDMSGGTDLGDLADAWAARGGYSLSIRSGSGWAAVESAHRDGRAIVIQGEGDCPGSGDFTGSHACAIGPEDNSAGSWLWSDPVTSGWQWASPGSIRAWAERLSSGIHFALSRAGGGEAMADVVVTDASAALLELEEGAEVLNLDGTRRTTVQAERSGTFTSPCGGVTPGGTRTRLIVWSRPEPDEDILLACYGNDAQNLRPIPGGGEDSEAVRRERDAEWIEALSETWPAPVEPAV